MKVLMMGNGPEVKGGITSVISQIREIDWEGRDVDLRFVPTYTDRGSMAMISRFVFAYVEVGRRLRSWHPDVAYIHMSYRGSYARAKGLADLCWGRGIPVIVHLHGSEFRVWFDGLDAAKKKEVRRFLRRCAAVIVLGSSWERELRAIEPAAKLFLLPNTVNVDVPTVSWQDGKNKILFLGALIRRKAVADLLEAMKRVVDKGTLDGWELVVAGSGPEEVTLKEKCSRLRLDGRVTFAGWVDGSSKESLLRSCQMLVLPSHNEGLPVAVLEAITHGMPVVATSVGDMALAVEDGGNGHLVEPGDVSALAEGIADLASDRVRWERAANRSREIALERFDERGYAGALAAIFDAAAGASSDE